MPRAERVGHDPAERSAEHLADLLHRHLPGGVELSHLRIARDRLHELAGGRVEERRAGIDDGVAVLRN
jgi:hypothetical protein